MTELTPLQQDFVDELVAGGCKPTEAARRAGFQHPGQEAYRLMRKPHVQDAVKDAQNRLIAGSGTNVALKTLLEVMQDTKAPASARVSAAGKMLDAAGHFSKKSDDDREKPLHEMTDAELQSFLERCNQVIASGAEPPVIRIAGQRP